MHPQLIPFLPIKTYGFCIAIGFLLAWQVLKYVCTKRTRALEPLSNLLMLLLVSGLVGARLAYVIEHWSSEFSGHLVRLIRIDQGGLMFYGGFILALLVFLIWCFLKKEKVLDLFDLFALVLPLAHACGRIGCFFYGCCYGRLSSSACAVSFPRGSPAWSGQFAHQLIPASATSSLPVLPTQLFEASALLILFACLFLLESKTRATRGRLAGFYAIGYALIRFLLEYLRGDPRAAIGPFSISQTISLGLLALGISLVFHSFRPSAQIKHT